MKTPVKLSILLVGTYAFIMYSPYLLDFQPKAYSLDFPDLEGPLKENFLLSEAEHLFPAVLDGPESIVFHNGELYTGVADGRILKIKDGKVIPVAHTGRRCEYPREEHKCGRPLGMRIGPDGLLYVADAYYGIFQMNFTTGALTLVLPINTEVAGSKMVFPDDVDIDNDGNLYISDASQRWDLSYLLYLMLEYDNTGRVLRYNIHTGKSEALAPGMHFPNGVQLTKDRKSLLFCELMKRRIMRYHLAGPKKGQMEVFADNLPAEPDNIRESSRGYWVAFTSARSRTSPLFTDRLNMYPNVKLIWARVHHSLSSLVLTVADWINQPFLTEVAYKFKRGDYYLKFFPRHGIIAEFDESGNILRSLQSPDGKTSDLSEVREHEGYLYLGSFKNHYLGRLKL